MIKDRYEDLAVFVLNVIESRWKAEAEFCSAGECLVGVALRARFAKLTLCPDLEHGTFDEIDLTR